MLNGIINVYKEAGYTSHDVVAKMRGICGQKKIGHTGTLDPDAVGVLPVCLGSGTKLCDMLTEKNKEYVAELLLGITTDTQDLSGAVQTQKEVTSTPEEVREAVMAFLGAYEQIPPMYSALKVNGRKLYELARAGKEVERQARQVTIYELEILKMELPKVKIRVVCSKGTYIRTLCADIGERLGCGGVMASLCRTRVGIFTLEEAVPLKELEKIRNEGRITEKLIPVDSLFSDCPALHVKNDFCKLIENGNAFSVEHTYEGMAYPEGNWVRIYDEQKCFYGIYAFKEQKHGYIPVKMFPG